MQPKGLLVDFGNTLLEEVSFDPRAGNEWLLTRATHRPAGLTIDQVMRRAARVTDVTAARRDQLQVETPWPMLTRLIHDYFGTRFSDSMAELELGFWRAAVVTRPMPGVRAALELVRQAGIPMAVLSNTSFGEHVIRYEIEKNGLGGYFEFVMVSSEYAVRKPSVLLFEVAASRLGLPPAAIWFVGDRLEVDVLGAKASGMSAVWFGRSQRMPLLSDADLVVPDWHEFGRQFKATGKPANPAQVPAAT